MVIVLVSLKCGPFEEKLEKDILASMISRIFSKLNLYEHSFLKMYPPTFYQMICRPFYSIECQSVRSNDALLQLKAGLEGIFFFRCLHFDQIGNAEKNLRNQFA